MAAKKRTKASPVAKKATKRTTKRTTKYMREAEAKNAARQRARAEVVPLWTRTKQPARGVLGMAVRNRRIAQKLTQKQLAEAVGCRHGWISSIECNDGVPSAFLAGQIFRVLRIRGAERQELLAQYPSLDVKRLTARA